MTDEIFAQILSYDSGAGYAPKLRLSFSTNLNRVIPDSLQCNAEVTASLSSSTCQGGYAWLPLETAVSSSVVRPDAMRDGNVGIYKDTYPKGPTKLLPWWDAANTCALHGSTLCTMSDLWDNNNNRPFFGTLARVNGDAQFVPFLVTPWWTDSLWAFRWIQVSTGDGFKSEQLPGWSWNNPSTYSDNMRYSASTPCCGLAGHPAYMAVGMHSHIHACMHNLCESHA
jgi:hypothetical protein